MNADAPKLPDWHHQAAHLMDVLRQRGITDERVLQRIAAVPRHFFVPAELHPRAYEDCALPIGQDQTISQPYIVALMTAAAELTPHSRVLEIGTGSGYQAAILSGLCQQVVTIERLPELAATARARFEILGLRNIHSVVGDGTIGVPEFGPYDAILVTAGTPVVPAELFQQTAENGRLIIPVGPHEAQELLRLRRNGETWHSEKLCDCRFVKLLGVSGWKPPTSPTGAA
ncbi:protein-L-isoaspartate(D-aspartate) O-methyltransferase [bacterium]|nr:protein-L-isoaspartate(D-aspartate) O-methyltransferase [bacterium]